MILLLYVCEWCKRAKKPAEEWILGLAAEEFGVTSSRREISILAHWSEPWANHPLAVHFCCAQHKENFVRALFKLSTTPQARTRRSAAAGQGRQSRATRRKSAAKEKRTPRVQPVFDDLDTVRARGLGILLGNSAIRGNGEIPPA